MPFSAQRVWFWFQVDSGVRLGEFMFGDLILLRIQKHKLIKHKVRFSLYFLFLWVKLCSNQILCMKSSKHHSGHRSINRSVHKTSENSSAQFHRAACDVSKSPDHENTSLHVSMFKKFSIQTRKQSFSFDQLINLRPDTCGSAGSSRGLCWKMWLWRRLLFLIFWALKLISGYFTVAVSVADVCSR